MQEGTQETNFRWDIQFRRGNLAARALSTTVNITRCGDGLDHLVGDLSVGIIVLLSQHVGVVESEVLGH